MVNKFSLILLLILVGLLSCESRELEQPSAASDNHNSTLGSLAAQPQFKYFMFVQTWPPSYCKSHRCAQNPERFTIHGLWPQDTGRPGTDQLTDDILNPRRSALLQYWPDLKTKNFRASKPFWRREYNRHGKYCTTKYSAEEYIVKTLLFGESFKTRAWLAKKNIVPDARRQYNRSDIADAIENYTSATPDLQCYTNRGKSYLLEVRLCLDDKLEKFINCGRKFGQCEHQVYYPLAPAGSGAADEVLEKVEYGGSGEII